MPSTNTPNMGLIAPTVGQQPGPVWAQNLNVDLITVDSHDHSPGNGVQITPAGMSITTDLSFMSNNAIQLRSTRYISNSVPLSSATDNQSLSVSGVDLYYVDGNGNVIRLTQSGSIAGTSGSISGLVSPASVTYVSGTPAFVFQSDSNKAADLDAGSIIIRKLTTGSPGITVAAPSALASNYTMTLPAAPPASIKIVTMDNSGNIGVTYDVDNVTLQVSSSLLGIKPDVQLPGNPSSFGTFTVGTGAGGAVLSNNGTTLVVESNGSTQGIQFHSSTGPYLRRFGNTSSDTLSVFDAFFGAERPIVVSANPSSTSGLMIVRGVVSANGGIVSGEGFSVINTSTGHYTINFNSAFRDTPSVTASVSQIPANASFIVCPQPTVSGTGSFTIVMYLQNGSATFTVNNDFSFQAIGIRD